MNRKHKFENMNRVTRGKVKRGKVKRGKGNSVPDLARKANGPANCRFGLKDFVIFAKSNSMSKASIEASSDIASYSH